VLVIRPLVVGFPRTMRAIPLRSLGVVSLLAVTPTVMTVVRAGHDVRLALVAAAVVGGAGLAYAIDDDAESLLAASPTSLANRRAARLAAALVLSLVSWGIALAVVGSAGLSTDGRLAGLAAEALAASGVAVAIAATVRRELGLDHTGLVGASAGVTAVLFLTLMSMRYSWLPRVGESGSTGRWLWVALAGWATVGWASRDPAAPVPGRRPG
jgi:hypothetical protein